VCECGWERVGKVGVWESGRERKEGGEERPGLVDFLESAREPEQYRWKMERYSGNGVHVREKKSTRTWVCKKMERIKIRIT